MVTRRIGGGLAALLLMASAVAVAEDMAVSVVRVQPGVTAFRVLQEDGIRPVPETIIGLRDLEDGEFVVSETTDRHGRCSLAVAEGRYVLAVNDMNIAIVQTDVDSDIREARILLPSRDLPVVGQAGPGDYNAEGTVDPVSPQLSEPVVKLLAIGGGIIVIGGIVAVGENNYWWRSRTRREPAPTEPQPDPDPQPTPQPPTQPTTPPPAPPAPTTPPTSP